MAEGKFAKRKEMPQIGSDEWKTFVADAIAKPPARRTAEHEAIKTAIAYEGSSATLGENENVTLQEFEAMAKRGRIHTSAEDTIKPRKADLIRAESAVDFGRLYGYSEDDIACFYLKRRRGRVDIAYSEYVQDCRGANFRPMNAKTKK